MALGNDRSAMEHVAIAERRPAVADIVGAGEHQDASLAQRLGGGTGAEGGQDVMIAT